MCRTVAREALLGPGCICRLAVTVTISVTTFIVAARVLSTLLIA